MPRKKKVSKKKVSKKVLQKKSIPLNVKEAQQELPLVHPMSCTTCVFADTTGYYCQRYPLKSKIDASHWCGDHKQKDNSNGR